MRGELFPGYSLATRRHCSVGKIAYKIKRDKEEKVAEAARRKRRARGRKGKRNLQYKGRAKNKTNEIFGSEEIGMR